MQEIADASDESAAGFTFAIPAQPEWADALAAIAFTGPQGTATLVAGDTTSPATTLVLDATTGRIRAILSETPGQQLAADRYTLGAPGTVTLFSRGIPDAAAWRR